MLEACTAQSLADLLAGQLEGKNGPVTVLADPTRPVPGSVVVLGSAAELGALGARLQSAPVDLGALVLPKGLSSPLPYPIIRVSEPRLAFARLSAHFAPSPPTPQISRRAHIGEQSSLGKGVSVGPGAVIGVGVGVGAGSRVGAGCVLGDGAQLGEGCVLHAGVTLYPGVQLGARVTLHSGVVVGSDGFGYALSPQGAVKVHHLGGVIIEDDVEIGANSCIDRGTLLETRIGARTKIDNLCQIGHNVQIGTDCLIAGSSAVGGSTVLERGVVLAGGVAVTDHVRIGQGARVGGRSCVTKSVPAGETWAGYPAKAQRKWVRELYLLGKLERIWESVKTLNLAAQSPRGPGGD